jgi:urease accessory protein
MRRATSIIRKSAFGVRIAVDSITLDRQGRHRRRVALTTDRGHGVLLDLPEATYMAHGDALALDNGTYIKIIAAAEPLLEIHAHSAIGLARIAWHIGNRHTPAEINRDAIYIQPDHVLAEMVVGLGAHVHTVNRPFDPEGGAYGGKGPLQDSHHGNGHGHRHSQIHGHSHSAEHSHSHAHSHSHSDTHGDVHDHEHGHNHGHSHPALPRKV